MHLELKARSQRARKERLGLAKRNPAAKVRLGSSEPFTPETIARLFERHVKSKAHVAIYRQYARERVKDGKPMLHAEIMRSLETWDRMNRARNADLSRVISDEAVKRFAQGVDARKAAELKRMLRNYLTLTFNISIRARRIVAEKYGVLGYQLTPLQTMEARAIQRTPSLRPLELQPHFERWEKLEAATRKFLKNSVGWNERKIRDFYSRVNELNLVVNEGMELYLQSLGGR